MNGPAGLFPAQDSQRPMAGHIASEPSYVDAVQAKGQAGITVRGEDEKHGRALSLVGIKCHSPVKAKLHVLEPKFS